MGATGLNERFPDLFMTYANCGDIPTLWGVPYELYGLALFVVAGISALSVWRGARL
jgi:hypothetical protein